MHRLATAVVGLLLGAGSLCGCGLSTTIDTPTVSPDALQRDVLQRFTEAGRIPQSVVCDRDLVGLVGATARCDVILDDASSFQPVITVTGVDGTSVNYEVTPALSRGQLEVAVAQLVDRESAGQVESVSCASGLEGRVGALTRCDVHTGGGIVARAVMVTTVSGLTMNFNLLSA